MPSPYSEDLKERVFKGVDKKTVTIKNQSNIQSEHVTTFLTTKRLDSYLHDNHLVVFFIYLILSLC
ncbi:hypothetical protein JSQ73_002285 [Wolbachia endosymbiont of Anopheles demeilloni]|uniref:hypothetical protein n=1 Tax=Wolbachia endosymbiont of Anopheles demeilloni TaxID=2748871 RepID=UPI001BDB5203|nr:hypothetical protein [Wolbachia endosymbiont of Anopheles demeilloni]UIP93158.1 hypothetical protein JSQ73_002285 [Wolbachia endosymbiont of Anopheles demeilloni]